MDIRRKILIGTVLLVVGVLAGIQARPWIARWAVGPVTPEQIQLDAVSLLDVLRPDPRLPDDLAADPEGWKGFWAAWDPRRARYSDEQLADLRRRLDDYLDFLHAEYADCAEIYRLGRPDHVQVQSDAAKEARLRVRADFGAFAETLVKQADEMREDAYTSSPKVAAGDDPALTDYRDAYDELVQKWLPMAHARVDQLTAPVAPK